jgi:hypothetical protein
MKESPEEMVMRVCQSFDGKPFTLHDAARMMVRQYPTVIPIVFSEGWESLIKSNALSRQADGSPHYELNPRVARAASPVRPAETTP